MKLKVESFVVEYSDERIEISNCDGRYFTNIKEAFEHISLIELDPDMVAKIILIDDEEMQYVLLERNGN